MKPDDDTEDLGALIRSKVTEVHAPDSLRASVAALAAPRRRRAPLRGFAMGFVAVGAACALLLVLVFGGSSTGGPSVADAATAALQPLSGPPPTVDPTRDELLTTHIDRLNFPRWDEAFQLRATGARHESLSGRRAVTVSYANRAGDTVGYTILATPPLDWPGGSRRVVHEGTPLWISRQDGATVVAWRRAGHTCVLASRTMPASQLQDLAAWTGGGAVGGYNG
jgi:hypothetical protein